jgi:hypothetical protein
MSTLHERLASLAGITLKESDFPRFKTIKIALADVGLEDQPDDVIMQFAARAAEANDVLTVEDWRVNRVAGTLEFDPMLSNGEVSPRQIAAFRSFAMDFLSDPENIDTYESVQEGKNDPGTARVSYTSVEGKRVSRQFDTHDKASEFVKKLAADHSTKPIYKGKPTTTYFNLEKVEEAAVNELSQSTVRATHDRRAANALAADQDKSNSRDGIGTIPHDRAVARDAVEKAKYKKNIEMNKRRNQRTNEGDDDIEEATGSNTPYDDIGAWKAAASKAGLEVYSQGAADGKYTAKKGDEVYGRFNQ